MNILYLTWGENVNSGGLFKGQVVSLLEFIKKNSDHKLSLIVGLPISRAFLKAPIKYFKSYKDSVSALREEGVVVKTFLIPVLSNMFYTNHRFVGLYHFLFNNIIKRFVVKNDIKIVHCRSYHSTEIGLRLKKQLDGQIKILFDSRGAFPEEGVNVKSFLADSESFRFWKKKENEFISNSDVSVCVSGVFSELFKKINQSAIIKTIPTTVNVDSFTKHYEISDLRRKLGIQHDEKVLVYLGVIGRNTFYSIDNLMIVYKQFKAYYEKSKLLIVSKHVDLIELEKSMKSFDLLPNDLIVTQSDSMTRTAQLLQLAYMAIYPTKSFEDSVRNVLLKVLIAAKTGEYLSRGIPILVHESAEAIAQLIRDQNLGAVYSDINNLESCFENIDKDYEYISTNCINLGTQYFSMESVGNKYLEIYTQLQ